MASNVKLFQTVLELYETMEIHEQKSNRVADWLNFQNIFFLVSMVIMIVTSAAYFLFRANTVQEYSDTFYVALTVAICLSGNFIVILQIANISKFISTFETFIMKSKFGLNSSVSKTSFDP